MTLLENLTVKVDPSRARQKNSGRISNAVAVMTARRAAGRHILYNTGRITAILRNGKRVSFFAVQIDIIDSAQCGNGAGIGRLRPDGSAVLCLSPSDDSWFLTVLSETGCPSRFRVTETRPRRAAQPQLKALQIGVTAVLAGQWSRCC